MNKVRINQGNVAVVSRKGDYSRLLKAGVHWLRWSESYALHDLTAIYTSGKLFDLRLRNMEYAQQVEMIEVKEGQIAIIEQHGLFHKVLEAGRYFYYKGLAEYKISYVDITSTFRIIGWSTEVLNKTDLVALQRVYAVEPYEKGVLVIDGQFSSLLDKGIHRFWKNASVIQVFKADMRQKAQEVNGQEILTKDKAAIRINFSTHFHITDVQKALMENKDHEKQLYVLTQLALRSYVGSLTLDELLENKDSVSDYVVGRLKTEISDLGISVDHCGIKDIILPGEMKEIMNQVMIAQKQAQANTITRREETASTRSLLNTAKLMEDNQMLYKLKEMEYLEKIADKVGEITVSGNGQVLEQMKQIFIK